MNGRSRIVSPLKMRHAFVLFVLLAGCPKKPEPTVDAGAAPVPVATTVKWDAKVKDDAIAAGAKVITKHQCTRCHTIDAQPTAARPLHCTSCHQFLKGLEPGKDQYVGLAKKYGDNIVERYQRNIVHLIRIPDLTGLGKRVRADWIATYLTEPYDLRPLLEESMFRHNLDPKEIRDVARYFAAMADAPDPWGEGYVGPVAPAKPDDARLAKGRTLFQTKGCGGCHVLGNVKTGIDAKTLEAGKAQSLLAPNLRFARERTRPEVIVDWIVDPKKVMPTTTMPAMGLSREDAEVLRDYIFHEDPALAPLPVVKEPEAPKPLERTVAWEEVKERVLGKVCVHCHMNDYEKDPGPGNLGGLGYTGVKLRMRTYETLVSGANDSKGARYSVLVPRQGETIPPIVQALLRRRAEAYRDAIPAFQDHVIPKYPIAPPGMPMGLPAMTDEEIQLLVTWIAQGCSGPTKVSGMEGANDGYLVPDGPIVKNKGCELRMPDKKRPAWAEKSEAPEKSPKPK
jgi:mono/diheme cytochrome c family protein